MSKLTLYNKYKVLLTTKKKAVAYFGVADLTFKSTRYSHNCAG